MIQSTTITIMLILGLIVSSALLYRSNQALKSTIATTVERNRNLTADNKALNQSIKDIITKHNAEIDAMIAKANLNSKEAQRLNGEAQALRDRLGRQPTIERKSAPQDRIDALQTFVDSHLTVGRR